MSRSPVFPAVPRTDFGPAPIGYVPGIGRGALGFTTRSDTLGTHSLITADQRSQGRGRHLPASSLPTAQARLAKLAERAQQEQAQLQQKHLNDAAEEQQLNEANYDQFSGYQGSLFNNQPVDKDDLQAEHTYNSVDKYMAERKKRKLTHNNNDNNGSQHSKINEQFIDLKRELATVTADEWLAIPEPLDYSQHNKLIRKFADKYSSVPDSIINNVLPQTTVTDQSNGTNTTVNDGTVTTDLTVLGKARDKILSNKLDQSVSDGTKTESVNAAGYLTEMSSIKINNQSEVNDIKKARLLLKSIISTNPSHAPGWIAASRLERETGKMRAARELIMTGIEHCMYNEDIWLEAVSLHTPTEGKKLLRRACKLLPQSVTLWLRAANIETDVNAKKQVLRRALEVIPDSVTLWKHLIELETNVNDVKTLLYSAVEICTQSTELWLTLARIETYDKAKIVLNRARKAINNDITIWIAAAKLEDSAEHFNNVDVIISKALIAMQRNNIKIERDNMLNIAESMCDTHYHTAVSIVKHCANVGINELDLKNILLADIDTYTNKQSYIFVRILLDYTLTLYSTSYSIYMKYIEFESKYGTLQQHIAILQRACDTIGKQNDYIVLWLMLAKLQYSNNMIDAARTTLQHALQYHKLSTDIYIALAKIEQESNDIEQARTLYNTAISNKQIVTDRLYMKYALFERIVKNQQRSYELLQQATKLYPNNWKLQLMLAQHYTQTGDHSAARQQCKDMLLNNKIAHNPVVWIEYARFELHIDATAYSRVRSILDTARTKCPNSDIVWIESIENEYRAQNITNVTTLQAKALQQCPSSGLLYAYTVLHENSIKRKSRAMNAVKLFPNDVYVFSAVARYWWYINQFDKAKNWFERAINCNNDIGDTWIYYYKFIVDTYGHTKKTVKFQDGDSDMKSIEDTTNDSIDSLNDVLNRFYDRIDTVQPKHGQLWQSVSKQDRLQPLKPSQIVQECCKLITSILPA